MDCSSLLLSKGQVECSRNSLDHITELQISPSIEALLVENDVQIWLQ